MHLPCNSKQAPSPFKTVLQNVLPHAGENHGRIRLEERIATLDVCYRVGAPTLWHGPHWKCPTEELSLRGLCIPLLTIANIR
eukprot:1835887-Amphidinium_carterae.1